MKRLEMMNRDGLLCWTRSQDQETIIDFAVRTKTVRCQTPCKRTMESRCFRPTLSVLARNIGLSVHHCRLRTQICFLAVLSWLHPQQHSGRSQQNHKACPTQNCHSLTHTSTTSLNIRLGLLLRPAFIVAERNAGIRVLMQKLPLLLGLLNSSLVVLSLGGTYVWEPSCPSEQMKDSAHDQQSCDEPWISATVLSELA